MAANKNTKSTLVHVELQHTSCCVSDEITSALWGVKTVVILSLLSGGH